MLTLVDHLAGCSRREFLRVGALGLGGLTLPTLLEGRAVAARAGVPVTGKSVIFLFQHGGPSQFETFDPKMDAPVEIRSVTGQTRTTIPGVIFGGSFSGIAQHAHRIAVVRSFQSGSSAHRIQPIVSAETRNANIGSLYSAVAGTTNSSRGIPTNAAIFPDAVDPEGPGENTTFGQFSSAGSLGRGAAPFVPGSGSTMQENLRLQIDRDRLDDRRALLTQLDTVRRQVDASGMLDGMDRFQEQAFQVILGDGADAFDLSKEDPRVIERYDTSHLVRSQLWTYKNNRKHYNAHAKSLGKLLLLARRLCEAGCGFVTINTAFVWDMHSDVNNLPMDQGMDYVGRPFEHAVTAFIEDIEARRLSDRILLVCTGEMGRTPKINSKGGRDHWGRLTPLMLYGGGITRGQVIGQSTRDGGEPQTFPINSRDLVSTILHNLFDVGQLRGRRGVPGEVLDVIDAGTPIDGLA